MPALFSSSVQNVSRETFLLLERYVALLQKWNRAINLVGKSTEEEIWQRHIADSLQLMPLIPANTVSLADLGSGAGLPGMVIAIARPELQVTLIEKDQRKSAFLREVAATLGLHNVTLLIQDVKTVTKTFPVITARAFASLDELCAMAYPLSESHTLCLFPKGKNFAMELGEASKNWRFIHRLIPSITQEKSSIVSITELSPT